MCRVIKKLRSIGICKFIQYIFHWCNEKYQERRLGIKTAGFISTKDLDFNSDDCSDYEPTSYAQLFKFYKALNIDSNKDVLIDYGSGKGRAVIVGAMYPFKRVIGVELSEKLNVIARNNFDIAKSRDLLKCHEAEFITVDAFDYQPTDDITVVFLNNPFSDRLVSNVITKLCESVKSNPRPLYFLYRFPEWKEDALKKNERLELVRELKGGYSDVGEMSKIYKLK